MRVKVLRKEGDKLVFRVCLNVYPKEVVTKVFGPGRKSGNYLIFRGKFKEKEVYEKFNHMLKEMMD